MARERNFDVDAAVNQLSKILQMELATVVYYTHYAFMIYGHASRERILLRSDPLGQCPTTPRAERGVRFRVIGFSVRRALERLLGTSNRRVLDFVSLGRG